MKGLSKKRKEEIMKQFDGRMPTKEEVFEKLLASQERLANALKGAWETKPDDPQVTKELLKVGERSAQLRKDIKKLFGEEKTES